MPQRVVIRKAECRFCLNCKLQVVKNKYFIKCTEGWWLYEQTAKPRIRHRLRSIMQPTEYFLNKHKGCPDFIDMRFD